MQTNSGVQRGPGQAVATLYLFLSLSLFLFLFSPRVSPSPSLRIRPTSSLFSTDSPCQNKSRLFFLALERRPFFIFTDIIKGQYKRSFFLPCLTDYQSLFAAAGLLRSPERLFPFLQFLSSFSI